jgi:cystathionine gamma-synthase
MFTLVSNAPNDSHVYSRETASNTSRFEGILANLFGGEVVTYSSGLSAFLAMVVLLNPKRIFIGDGYHGVHGVIDVMHRLTGLRKLTLEDLNQVQPGDIVHIETPLNPTGEARNLVYYAAKAHGAGAYLTVDSTFGPPPLQDPLQLGADIVMHSGTKYIGGHSDMLCGILVVAPKRVEEGWLTSLRAERMVLGNVMGNMEGWLGIRSLRTLHLRVSKQSQSAEKLVHWLDEQRQHGDNVVSQTVERVQHASLQHDDIADGWLKRQMSGGFGPVFTVWTKEAMYAKRLPSKLFVFQHATSLGGVESLIEWRKMSDKSCDERLLRFSVGVEDFEDLEFDLKQGLEAVLLDAKRS